jgi:hypothetical protein
VTALEKSDVFNARRGDPGRHSTDVEKAARDRSPDAEQTMEPAKATIHSLDEQRSRQRRTNHFQPTATDTMSDTPSRTEIAAQLQAAEARTETRIVQLSASMEARASASDHKIDLLIGKIDTFAGLFSEKMFALSTDVATVQADSKETRKTIWVVGVGSVLTILALVVALWIAGINVQNNMIAVFQAGLGLRTIPQETELPRSPASSPPSTPVPPASPPKK